MIKLKIKELHFAEELKKKIEFICMIRGTSSIVEDIKNLYLELFEDARIKYNEKQIRNDRNL